MGTTREPDFSQGKWKMSYVKSSLAKQQLGCSAPTLRRWANRGYIRTVRTNGDQRLYDVAGFLAARTVTGNPVESSNREKIIYCRVSSSKQKEDLKRQVERLVTKYPGYEVYKEIASGINFKRTQLYRILDRCFQGFVEEVVVAHRDRLCRIAFDHFDWLFQRLRVRLVIDSDDVSQRSSNEELAEDLMSIVHVFSSRHYGARRSIAESKLEKGSVGNSSKKGKHDSGTSNSFCEEIDGREHAVSPTL